MGSWFSNLHIRKTETVTGESVCEYIKALLEQKKYTLVECAQDADATIAVTDVPNSQWISICSQAFAHDDPETCKAVAAPLSAQLHTDVLGIACFDSDYLYLNLINTEEAADAWVGIGAGKEVGITRRNNLTAWKKKVADYTAFSAAAKCGYPCAEEFLSAAAGCLGLSADQGCASLDCMQDTGLHAHGRFLYFRQEEGAEQNGPGLEIWNFRYAVPCFDGRENSVSFLNAGQAFRGLSVYFLGPYVEHEEIRFTDVRLEGLHQMPMELALKKVQLPDGQWSYHCHVPEIQIPPGIPRRTKPENRYLQQMERMRKIVFVPHGDPRAMLDITVVIAPDRNPDHQARWNIWQPHGSKEAFIKHHNNIWKRVRAYETDPNQCLPLLNPEDFKD